MLNRYFAFAVALTFGAPLFAQTATTRLETVSGVSPIDKTGQAQDIRMRTDRDNRMTVPVHLAGVGPYQFLVDTGADRTAVSRDLVSRLALPIGGTVEMHTISGVSVIKTAHVLGDRLTQHPETVEAAVLDGGSMGADGIIGADLLRSERVQFDFEKQTMTIVPSRTPDFRAEGETIVVRAWRRNGRLIVTDAKIGQTPVTVVLDTGSDVSMGNEALRNSVWPRDVLDGAQKVELLSVTGATIVGDLTSIRLMAIGGIELRNLSVVITDAHTFKQLGLRDRPALLLGMNAMRAFKKVSIDFANKKFRVVMPEHSALDTEFASRGGH